MTDAVLGVRRIWIGDPDRSFNLEPAGGMATFTPSHTSESFVPGDKATRRTVVQRMCDASFESLYWNQHGNELLEWINTREFLAVLCEVGNGAAFYVEGPAPSFSVSAPTDALIRFEGSIENGREILGLVGHRIDRLVLNTPNDFGVQPGFDNWDWTDESPIYAVTVIDEATRSAANTPLGLRFGLSNMADADGNAIANKSVYGYVGGSGNAGASVDGAGVQRTFLIAANLAADAGNGGRRGTIQLNQQRGITANTLRGGAYLMQQVGAADLKE